MQVTPEASTYAPDPRQVLRYNYAMFARRLGARLGIFGVLLVSPFVMLSLGVPDSFWTAFPVAPGVIGLGFTFINFRGHPFRLRKCKKILSEYPLERGSVSAVGKRRATHNKTFITFDVTQGEGEQALEMTGVEPQGLVRWPTPKDDVLIAGDLPFGGVVVVPSRNELFLMQPSDWHGTTTKRTGASPDRITRAKAAGIEFWTL